MIIAGCVFEGGINMKKTVRVENWRVGWLENKEVLARGIEAKRESELLDAGIRTVCATVPGNIELDLMREGLLDDIYFGEGSLKTQRYENLHLYYTARFTLEHIPKMKAQICFGGIDTVAEIFIDGEKIGFVENMLHAHRFSLDGLDEGEHEILVHIIPVTIYSRKFDIPAMCFGLRYNHDGIAIRKPGYMFGWDIMPRIVSAGLWKDVEIEYLPEARIVNPYTYTVSLTEGNRTANMITTLKIESDEDFITDYTVVIEGKCKDSSFRREYRPFCASMRIEHTVDSPKLWWPKNYGDQELYDVTVTLLYKGVECDRYSYKLGIRTLWLKRTSRSGDEGDFCFIINGKRIFVMGTNWVPTDALPSRHDEYTIRGIEMANDLGCNMIRCWGGNVYPSELLYNYCDENGILIWQDFSVACGHYPDDERLCRLVREEIKQVVIEKRQHPSLALWAGDNECDVFVVPYYENELPGDQQPSFLNPTLNMLTREVILREVRNHDAIRPYLPSSPYLDDEAYKYGMPSENHIWGPRDFFKGDYYINPECHFASEIGYHGCPSPDSVRKFIPEASIPKDDIHEICKNGDWLVHAAGMVSYAEDNPYAYRLPLMISHVERIFGKAPADLSEFAMQSQISQAEAKKFFIERFRYEKWRKTGILWWNVIDGWPQVSDAIVDWYGTKKLAYSYIKRSQQPFAIMCTEPKGGEIELVASNDMRQKVCCKYKVTDLRSDRVIHEGSLELDSDGLATVARLPEIKGGFYLIEWFSDSVNGRNHFVCNIGDGWTFEEYFACMKKAGFDKDFEGFGA